MAVALSLDLPQSLLSNLIVADMAPSRGPLSPEFRSYIEAMKKIEDSKVTSRREAQQILSSYEPVSFPLTSAFANINILCYQDPEVRAFLLTNLQSSGHETHHHPLKFRVPLDIIGNAIVNIGDFPYEPGDQEWEGPTLFIKGTRSKYVSS